VKALPSLEAQPVQTKWDEPEDPKYLLPLPKPKDADFEKVSGCKVFASDLGYRLHANGKETLGLALKKLDEPITGTATFRTRIRAVPESQGRLRNGYVAFGRSAEEAELVKCGVRLQPQKASIIQGPLRGGKQQISVSADVDAPAAKGLEAVVTVDLATQQITYVANGVPLNAKIKTPLRTITHVGYVMEGALIDVAALNIDRLD
jgi:hypothetical protein